MATPSTKWKLESVINHDFPFIPTTCLSKLPFLRNSIASCAFSSILCSVLGGPFGSDALKENTWTDPLVVVPVLAVSPFCMHLAQQYAPLYWIMLVTIDRAGRSHVHAINAALRLYFPLSGDSTSMPSSNSFRWLNIVSKNLS